MTSNKEPEAIPKDILDECYKKLTSDGIDLTGIGITKVPLKPDGEPAIYIMCLTKKDAKKVPEEYAGYKIVKRVTGKIRPL